MTDAHIFNYEEEIRLWTSPHISLNQSALAELPAVQHWEAGAAEGSGMAHSVITLDVCWAALEGPERNIAILRLIIYIFRKEVLDFLLPFHLPWLQADRVWVGSCRWVGREVARRAPHSRSIPSPAGVGLVPTAVLEHFASPSSELSAWTHPPGCLGNLSVGKTCDDAFSQYAQK